MQSIDGVTGWKIVKHFIIFLMVCFALGTVGCGGAAVPGERTVQPAGSVAAGENHDTSAAPDTSGNNNANDNSDKSGDDGSWRIRVINAAGEELWSFTEAELDALSEEHAGAFAHVYSTINNWPTAKFYVAGGYSVISILAESGLYDTAQTVTFRSTDGYEASLTRDQLYGPQFYYPLVGEHDSGAEPVMPIIAYRWREGTADIGDIREDKPTLIFGQRNPYEHTNPAFVEGISEIMVDIAPCETWQPAGTFPAAGPISQGETVKLQHPSFGLVKLFYTLDGSDPTTLSTMYNPSTYQPELNTPIPITEPTTIKVLVTGYGKGDSEIAVFEFWPVG